MLLEASKDFVSMFYHRIARRVLAYVDMVYRVVMTLIDDVDLLHIVHCPPATVYNVCGLPFVLRSVKGSTSSYELSVSNSEETNTCKGVHTKVRFCKGVLCSVVTHVVRESVIPGIDEEVFREPRRLKFLLAEANDVPCSKRLRNVYTMLPLTAFDVVALAGETGAKLTLVDQTFEHVHYIGNERVI